jgi:hypothetical protein
MPDIPDYADEAARKFFTKSYWGGSGVERMCFDHSHPDLRPTQTVRMFRDEFCAYCANRAKAIQGRQSSYDVTGYCCICPDAFRELRVRATVREVETKIREIEKDLPPVAKERLRDKYIQILKERPLWALDFEEFLGAK